MEEDQQQQQQEKEIVSNLIVGTNHDTLSVPIRFGVGTPSTHHNEDEIPSVKLTKHGKDKDGNNSPKSTKSTESTKSTPTATTTTTNKDKDKDKTGKLNVPSIDFGILTRPNSSKRLGIKFKNHRSRPVVVVAVEMMETMNRKRGKDLDIGTYIKIERNFNNV